jgi:uncharacterized protein YbjT (DUF2867 family)
MRIVVVGGTGLIGSQVVEQLNSHGHTAVPASPVTGVNTLTGAGLPEVLKGADVVVDVSNSPSFESSAVMDFFSTSTRNLLAAEAEAGVGHHVALSVVGTDRMTDGGYMKAKLAQEKLIEDSPIPFSIVRATQFFEFLNGIAGSGTTGRTVTLPPVLIAPMASADVAKAVGRVAAGKPVNGTVEIGGPDEFRMDEFVRRGLAARHDPRTVVADPHATYFGAQVEERTLLPGKNAMVGDVHFADWAPRQMAVK